MSSSLCFSKFCFTENISRSTHFSGFSLLLNFLLSFQCKAQYRSGCCLHFSICEQEWKEFQSSSEATELAPVYQPGAALLWLFPAVFQAEPGGGQSRWVRAGWGSAHGAGVSCLASPTAGCSVPGLLRAGCAKGVPVSPSQCLCCPWNPAGCVLSQGLSRLWALCLVAGPPSSPFPDCPLALATPPQVFCALLHKISAVAMHSTLLS